MNAFSMNIRYKVRLSSLNYYFIIYCSRSLMCFNLFQFVLMFNVIRYTYIGNLPTYVKVLILI